MPEVTRENAIKELCVSINGDMRYAQSIAKEVNRGAGGREIALCITKLQEARQWAQEALNEIGSVTQAEGA